jgi:hypothetical protein
MESTARDRLKKKLNQKKKQRGKGSENVTGIAALDNDESNIFDMISQVQSILKSNPEMISKVNSCVNSLMGNQDLMNQLSSQLSSQTLASKSDSEQSDAVSNESKQ